ncbi:hypothetical protein LIER_33591 [Lithospermum erythrorhizon]|uniref:DUF659 domain-containing protein n=1 Tax=Lithospermum erythrorhizon TaxID=34254 RepID=A0AAV3RXA2_LITER
MDDIEEIGEKYVIQVVTDNGSAYKKASALLMRKRKNLYWTPCAAHCINLILEYFAERKTIKEIIATCLHNYLLFFVDYCFSANNMFLDYVTCGYTFSVYYLNPTLHYNLELSNKEELLDALKRVIQRIEPDVELTTKSLAEGKVFKEAMYGFSDAAAVRETSTSDPDEFDDEGEWRPNTFLATLTKRLSRPSNDANVTELDDVNMDCNRHVVEPTCEDNRPPIKHLNSEASQYEPLIFTEE